MKAVIHAMGLLPNDIELLSPYDDRIFKAFLTLPGSEPALKFVASAIINRPVVRVQVRNAELPVTDTEEKAERFDINCEINDDSQADIEMQSSRMKEERDSNHKNLKAISGNRKQSDRLKGGVSRGWRVVNEHKPRRA